MSFRSDLTQPKQNVYSREYQSRHEERTTRISSSSGRSTPTFTFSPSRESNPTMKWNEYLSLSQQLTRWLKETILDLSRRDFPQTLSEIKIVAQDFERFRTNDVSKKSQERYLIANIFDDLQNTTRQFPMKTDQHINEVNKLWNEFVMALQEKDSSIHIELTRLQKMDSLIDRVYGECSKCKDLLDNMEAKMMAVKKWGHGSRSILSNMNQLQSNIEESFQVLFSDLQKLQQTGHHEDLSSLARNIQSLRKRYSKVRESLTFHLESGNSSDTSQHEHATNFITNQMQSCFQWMKDKEEEMEKAGYGNDLRSSFDFLEMQKKLQQEIKDFQTSIQDCINAKKSFPLEQHVLYNKQLSQLELLYIQLQSTSNFRLANLRTLVSFLRDSSTELEWMKEKEAQASDRVSSVDVPSEELEKFYSFGKDLKSRSDKFSSLLERGDNLIRDQHPATNTIQFFCNLLQVQRAWHTQLSQCMEVHINNVKSYKQFHNELVRVDKWLTKQMHLIDGLSGKQALTADDAQKIIDTFTELKKTIHQYGDVINTISHQSTDVPSLKLSSKHFPPNLPIRALCSYKLSNFSILEGESCILLNDSLSSKWKVKNSSGMEGILPSVCFVVCSQNEETSTFISRLKKSYIELTEKVESILSRAYKCLATQSIHQVKDLNAVRYQEMALEDRSVLRRNLNESSKYLLHTSTKEEGPTHETLRREFNSCQQALDDFDQRINLTYSKPNTSVILLNDFGKLIQNIDSTEHEISSNSRSSFYPSSEKVELARKQLAEIEGKVRQIEGDVESAKHKYLSMNPSQRTSTIEDMYNKLLEKLQHVIQIQTTLSKRLELTTEFLNGKSKIEKFMHDIEDSVLKYPNLSSNASQVDEVRSHLQKLKNEFLKNHELIDDMEMKSKFLKQLSLKHAAGVLLYPDSQFIAKDLNDVRLHWDELQKEIMQSKSDVDQAYEHLKNYKSEERKINNLLSDYENSFNINGRDTTLDLVKSTENLVSLLKNVKSFRFKMDDLNKSSGSFLREAKMYENKLEQFWKKLGRRADRGSVQKETVSADMKSLNDRYLYLMENLKANLSLRKPILEKLKCLYVLDSDKDAPTLRTYQSEMEAFQPSGSFVVPSAMEDHFQAETSWSKPNANRLTSVEEKSLYSSHPSFLDTFDVTKSDVLRSDVTDSTPQEEHMHSEDTEECFQPIKDGEEKITKHTKQEFHSRKTASGFESVSTHERKLLSLVSTEASAYSGKIKFPLEVNRAIQYQLLDDESGTFTHPESNEKIPLSKAIEMNLLLIEDAVFTCPTSMKSYSLRNAFRLKLLDSHGFFSSLDGVTNFKKLIEDSFIKFKSDREESMLRTSQLAKENEKATSSLASNEKIYFAISSVIDPTTKKPLDAFTAVQRGILDQANAFYNGKDFSGNVVQIPIRDAIRLGLVFAEETPYGIQKNKLIKETKTFTLTGVIDPISRKNLTLIEAVNMGYIDQMKGLFINPIKKVSIPITEAISLGHVLADVNVSGAGDDNDDEEGSSKKILTSKEVAFTISSIINPFNGKELSASLAIKMGIFDSSAGMYKNLKTNETMTLNEAIDRKLITVVQGRPKEVDHLREEKVASLHIDDEMDAREEMAHEEIIEERKTFQITGVREPRSGKYISFPEAVACRLIDEAKGMYCDYIAKQYFTIPDALEKGFIIGTTHMIDQQELFKSAIVAQKKEDIIGVYNPITNTMVSANEALQLGLLNKDMTLYFDPANNDVIKIDIAILKGYVKSREKSALARRKSDASRESAVTKDTKVTIDWSGGRVLNRTTKDEIPISKALEHGLIEDYIAAILKMKNPDTNGEEKVEEKSENESVSMKMAVQVTYLRDESGRIIIEDESFLKNDELGFQDESSEIYSGLSFHDVVILGLYDIRKGIYFDPFSKKTFTLKEAIESGCINPHQPALIDISNGRKVSLNSLINDGILSLVTGSVSLSKLLNLDVTLDPDFLNFLSHTVNLEDAIRCGLFDDGIGIFQLPFSRKTLDLESAVKHNYISGDANVVLNPLTGERLLLNKAIELNVINGKTGKFTDSTLEKNITISKAIILGLIKQRYQDKCSIVMDCQSGDLSPLEDCVESDLNDLPCVYDPKSKSRISLSAAASTGLINKSKKTYLNQISGSELSLSKAAKMGLIYFPGAPILSNTECTSDVTQSSLQTNISLLKGARLQENITDSFGDVSSMGMKDFAPISKSKKLSDSFSEVSFVKNEPNKKSYETKTYDTNTDETPVSVEITRDGKTLIATRRVVDKVQKSQIKETLESINDDSDCYSRSPSFISDMISTPAPMESNVPVKSEPEECVHVTSLSKAPTKQIHQNTLDHKLTSNGFQTKHEPNPVVEDFDFESAASARENIFASSGFKPVVSSRQTDREDNKKKEQIHLDWKTGNVTSESKIMTPLEAYEKGLIEAHVKDLLEEVINKARAIDSKHITLNDALIGGLLILPLSKVRNSVTNQNLTIEEAVAVNYIDLDRSVIIDPLDMRPRSITELVERQVFNIENAVMRNSATGKIMTLSDIVRMNLIPQKGLPDVKEVKVLSFNEALNKGLLDEHTNQFTEHVSGYTINLETALRIGYLKYDPNEKCSSRIKKHKYPTPLTLLEAVKSGILNLETFLYTNPYSGETISMADSISRGLILVPELDTISDVEGIDFKVAYRQGYLDILDNIFIDPITSVLMPLDAAIKKGYVILPRNALNLEATEVNNKIETSQLETGSYTRYLGFSDLPLEFGDALICGLYDEVNGTFLDPYENGPLTLEEALQYNLIKVNSKVKDPLNGIWISLSEAIKNGHVDPISGKFVDPSTFSAIPLKEAEEYGMFYSTGPCLWVGKFQNSDRSSSGTVSFNINQVFDPIKKCWISPEEAIQFGYLSIYNDYYADPTCNKNFSLLEAMNKNKIIAEIFDPQTTQHSERTYIIKSIKDPLSKQEISPNIAEQKQILDMNDKTYSNFYNRSKISLFEAYLLDLVKVIEVDAKEFKADDVKDVMDYTTGEKWTLTEAIDNCLIDSSMSYYIDPKTGQKLTLYEAWQRGYVFLKSDNFHGIKSRMIKSVIDPRTGEEIPISDAIRHQIVDKLGNKYWNMQTNTFMDLDYAIEKGLVLTESAEKAVRKPAIVEIEDNLDSRAKVYVIESVRDPTSSKEYDPIEAERRGYINKIKGIYMNPLTGKQISIKRAIDQGYIHASAVDDPDYDMLKKNEDAYAVFESNKYIKEINVVVDPITNEKISLFEGVRRGFVDLHSSSQSRSFAPIRDSLNKNISLSSLSQSSQPHDYDDDYSFKVTKPLFFTVLRSSLDNPSQPEKRMATPKSYIDHDKEIFYDQLSSQTMSILEGLNSGKLIEDCPSIDRRFETIDKISKKISNVDGNGSGMHGSTSLGIDPKSRTIQINYSSGGRDSSHASHWKDGFTSSVHVKNHHGYCNDDRSSVSKEDIESLDQLLAELEHGRGDDDRFQNCLQIDDSVLAQPNHKKEYETSNKAFYKSFERKGFNAYQKPVTSTDCKTNSKNEHNFLNDSLSDLLSEDLNEELAIREDYRLESLNLDSEKTSVGRSISIASTSDFGREQITLDELVRLSLYDKFNGMVRNPETGKQLPLLEAIERGIVQKNSVKLCDPASGKLITLTEAFERGIMDAENGNLTDVYTGKTFKFCESVCKAMDMKPSIEMSSNKLKPVQECLALCSAFKKNYFDGETRRFKFPDNPASYTLKEAIDNGYITTRNTAIKDVETGHKIFLDTLIALGLVDQERGLFRDTQGCFTAIEKAFEEKVLFDCEVSPRPHSLKVLLENGLYSRDSDSFFDPDTKQFVSLKDAINKNLLDPKSVLCIDSSNNEIVSLSDAIARNFIGSDMRRNSLTLSASLDKGIALKKPIALSKAVEIGLLNETTGKFLDPSHRKFFTLKEALDSGFISEDSTIADPSTRNLISLSEAVSSGIVDLNTSTVTNPNTKETFSLKEACTSAKFLKRKLSNESPGNQERVAFENINITINQPQNSPIQTGNLNSNLSSRTNEFLYKLFKKDINVEEALNTGLIDQDSCLIGLPWSNEILSLKILIENGLIDLKQGIVTNSRTSELYSFADIVLKESIDCNNNNFSLAEALDLEIFNPETGIVIDPNSERKMSLFESIKSNLISYQKTVLILNGELINLLEAFSKEFVSPVNGDVKDIKTNKKLSFFDAVQQGIILDAHIPPQYSFDEMYNLGLYNKTTKNFVNPFNKKNIGLKECLGLELLDANKCFIYLPDAKEHIPLMLAFNQNLLTTDLNLVSDPSSGKQYPVVKTLDGSLEAKDAPNQARQDEEVKNLDLLLQKLEIYKDWVSDAYQQIGSSQITANKNDLGREMKRLQNFSGMVNEVKPDMVFLHSQIERIMLSQGIDKSKLEKLKTLNQSVKSQYNMLLENVKQQIKLLQACQEELIKYEDEKKKFETWLTTAVEELDTKFSNFKCIKEVGDQKEALKNYVDEVFIRQGDLKYVEICKNQFLDQARHFDALQLKNKNLKRSSSHLDLLYSMIDDLRQLTNEYNSLRSNARTRLDRVEALNDCLKRMEDIDKQIKFSLEEIKETAEYSNILESKDKMRIDVSKQLKSCSSELQSQFLFFEKMKNIVSDIARQLNHFGMTENLQNEISNKVRTLDDQLTRVDEIIKTKNTELDSLSFANQSVADEVKELSSLVGSVECLVEEMNKKKTILDEDTMIGRIQEMKTLGQEINDLQQPLSHLMHAGSSGTLVKQLHKRYKDVADKFKTKETELEEAFAFVNGFNLSIKELKKWMNNILLNLEDKETSIEDLKTIHNNICDRSNKFMNLESKMIEYLTSLEAVGGKEKLKEMIEETKIGLSEVENLCLTRISQEEKKVELETTFKRLKDKILFWVEEKENMLNAEGNVILGDVKLLDECVEDFHGFKDYVDELNDVCLGICELLTDCDRVSSAYQRLRRCFRKGVRSPSPISFAMKHFDFEEVTSEHQRTAMELTSRYEMVGERLENEKKELLESLELLEELERDCRNLSLWLDRTGDSFGGSSSLSSTDEVSHLESCRVQLLKKESNINSLRQRLQQLPRALASIKQTSALSEAINDLAKRWEKAESTSARLLESCSKQADDLAVFKSLHSQLNSWLSMKEKVIAMCLGSLGADCDVLDNQRIQIELLKEEMKSEQENYDLFMKKGHKIIELSGSEEIYNFIEEINTRWDRVQNKLREKESAIVKLLATCTPFYEAVSNMIETSSVSTKLFSDMMQSLGSNSKSSWVIKTQVESLDNQQACLKDLLDGIKRSADELKDLVNESNAHLKIHNKVVTAEKSYKHFLKSYDLAQKHMSSRKEIENKTTSDLGNAATWMDGILRNLNTLEEASLEPSTLLSLHQLFQNLKENFEAKENNVTKLIKSSKEISESIHCDEFDRKLGDVCRKFEEVKEKIELMEPKIKLISEKANQCIADIDKLSLWLDLTNSKFLSNNLSFDFKNLPSKINEALHLKSEFDIHSVDLDMVRNVINEMSSLSAGASSNMEQILLNFEHLWNASRKENETRLKMLEDNLDKLDEFNEIHSQIDSYLKEKQNTASLKSVREEDGIDAELDGGLARLKEILIELSTDGCIDEDELNELRRSVEALMMNKNKTEKQLLEAKQLRQQALTNMEDILKEVDAITEDQSMLEDCIEMNFKNKDNLSKLKEQSEYSEVFKKQCEFIENKINECEKTLKNLISENIVDNFELIQDKIDSLKDRSSKTSSYLEHRQNMIKDSINKLQNLDMMCNSTLESITEASDMLESFTQRNDDDHVSLEQVQRNVKDFQDNVMKKIGFELKSIKSEKELLSKTQQISISQSLLDSKIVKLNDIWTTLNKKLSNEEQKLHAAFLERGNFTEAIEGYSMRLSNLEAEVEACDGVSLDASSVGKQIHVLKDIRDKIRSYKSGMKTIEEMAESQMNRKSLTDQIDNLNDRWTQLYSKTEKKLIFLNELLEMLNDYQQKLNSYDQWLKIVEEKMEDDTELNDVDANDATLDELRLLSEEVHHYTTSLGVLHEASKTLSDEISDQDVVDILDKNMADVSSRLENVACKLHASKDRLKKYNQLMKEFNQLLEETSTILDGFETLEHGGVENYKDLSAQCDQKIKTLNNLFNGFKEFLSIKSSHEYSDALSIEQGRYQKIMSQIMNKHEMLKAKKEESAKFQQEVNVLLNSICQLNEILESPQKLTLDPSDLKEKLSKQKILHDKVLELKNKSRNIVTTLRRQSRIFEVEPTLDESISKMVGRLDSCIKMSTFKVHILDQAYPLSLQFHETMNEINKFLEGFAISFSSIDCSSTAPIKQQQDDFKVLKQEVLDQRFLLDRFNSTALQLARLFENKNEFEEIINDVNKNFNDAKIGGQNKINDLEQAFYETAQMSEKIDDLSDMSELALMEIESIDSVPCLTNKLTDQIESINTVRENVENKKQIVELLLTSFELSDQLGGSPAQELVKKASHVSDVYQSALDEVETRKSFFEKVLKLSQKFWNCHASISNDTKQLEEHLKRDLDSFNETPLSNVQSLEEHASAILESQEAVENIFERISDLKRVGNELLVVVDGADGQEVKDILEVVMDRAREVQLMQNNHSSDVSNQLEDLDALKARLRDNAACLEDCEQQLNDFNEDEVDYKTAGQFLKNLYDKGLLKLHETQILNNKINELARKRTPSHLTTQIKDLKSRWMQFNNFISKKVDVHLQNLLTNEPNEIGRILEMLYKWSDDKLECIESLQKPIKGCLSQINLIQNQLQIQKSDISNHQSGLRMISNMLNKRSDKESRQMNFRMTAIRNNIDGALSKIKMKDIEIERLRGEAKEFDESMEVISDELDRIDDVARSHANNYTPASIPQQYFELQTQTRSYDNTSPKVDALLKSESFEAKHSTDPNLVNVRKSINSIETKRKTANKNLEKWKKKLDLASERSKMFERHHAALVEWLGTFEKQVKKLLPVRTTSEGCRTMILLIQSYREELKKKQCDLKKLDTLALQMRNKIDKTEMSIIDQILERLRHSFKNNQLKLFKLMTACNRALENAASLDADVAKFVEDVDALEQKLADDNGRHSKRQFSIDEIKNGLKEHQKLKQLLGRKQSQYDGIVNNFKSSISASSPEDQLILNEGLSNVKNRWSNLCQRSVEWQHRLEESLLKDAEVKERIDTLLEWLNKAEPQLTDQQNLCGNLDFVTELEEEHNIFLEELTSRASVMNSIEEVYKTSLLATSDKNNNNNNNNNNNKTAADEEMIGAEILQLKHKWNVVNSLAATKSEQIRLALEKARTFDTKAEDLMTWLEDAEEAAEMMMMMPTHFASDNEETIQQYLQQIEVLSKNISDRKPDVDAFLSLSNEVLMQAHPGVLQDLTTWINNFQTRCEVLDEELKSRRLTLMTCLDEVKKGEEELNDLIFWLVETEKKLRADDERPIVESSPIVEQLFQEFELLESEIQGKQTTFEKLMKSGRLQGSSMMKRDVVRKEGRRTPEKRVKNERMNLLNDKWRQVWVLMMDRRRKLQDVTDRLNKMEQLKNFDPDEWMEKFFKWMNNNFSRVINLFRKYDRKISGKIKRTDFIQGVLNSNFTTSTIEIEIVADLFDDEGLIDYKQFASNMQSSVVEESETVKILNEIERLSQKCSCQRKYLVVKQAEGKYKFGTSQIVRLVRIQRSCVMVRVGGGWVTLEEFLIKNDPCRTKKRASPDCKEQFVLAEGVSQAMSHFKPKSPHSKSEHRHVSASDLSHSSKQNQKFKSRSASRTPDPI